MLFRSIRVLCQLLSLRQPSEDNSMSSPPSDLLSSLKSDALCSSNSDEIPSTSHTESSNNSSSVSVAWCCQSRNHWKITPCCHLYGQIQCYHQRGVLFVCLKETGKDVLSRQHLICLLNIYSKHMKRIKEKRAMINIRTKSG